MLVPRPYQEESITSIFNWLFTQSGNPIVGLPTGTGKSLVIAEFLRRLFYWYPTSRVVVLTHVKELVDQDYKELLECWPTAPAGIYSAGLKRKDTLFPITFCGIASIAKRPEVLAPVGLILVDECHLIGQKDSTQYHRVIERLRSSNPNLRVVGFTATPYRLGQGMLTDNGIFAGMCIDYTSFEGFNQLVDEGYICPLVPKKTQVELNTDGVATLGGDFVQSQLQDAVDKDDTTRSAIAEAIAQSQGRKHWLVFCTGTRHADHVCSILNEYGISAACVHTDLPGGEQERDLNIQLFKSGSVTALVGVGVFATGFNFKPIDLIVYLRPTKSPGFWVQSLGRGTRPVYGDGFDLSTREGRLAAIAYGSKPNCLVLDFAANTRRLGPINDPLIPKKRGKGSGEAPFKVCGSCATYCHARATYCPVCGTVFPVRPAHGTEASSDVLIKTEKEATIEVADFDVTGIEVRKHSPRDSSRPPSLRIDFICGLRRFTRYLCFEHGGYPSISAGKFWTSISTANGIVDALAPPTTVDDAVSRSEEIICPQQIRIVFRSKFHDVAQCMYTSAEKQSEGTNNPF